jgi:hypothetical protein
MTSSSLTEAQLDEQLANALRTRADFAQWFLEQTKFRLERAVCVLCREDNPWSSVASQQVNPTSGEVEVVKKDRETDVLAVYETGDGRRLALHIENKLENGFFTPHQPESYQERLSQWRMRKKLGMYEEATSVLVAPRSFYERHLAAAQAFESYVPYEELGQRIVAFKRSGESAA